MKVKVLLSFALVCSALIIASGCYAQTTTSLELLNDTKHYDGRTVNYKGEVIGDVMIRGDHAWLHVNDGYIAIAIWAPKTLIEDILYAGDYRKKGDTVEVLGTFHRACSEHGGDLDIHASEIKKVTQGNLVIQPMSSIKIYAGISSLALVLLFYALNKFFQSRKR